MPVFGRDLWEMRFAVKRDAPRGMQKVFISSPSPVRMEVGKGCSG